MDSFVPGDVNETSTDPNCLLTKELAESVGLKVMILVRMIIDFGGIAGVGYGFLFKTRGFLLHGNARILVYFHLFYCLIASMGYFSSHLVDIARLLRNHTDPCMYKMKIWVVFCVRQFTFAGSFGQVCTIILIAIERLISTFQKDYERSKCRKTVAVVCILKLALVLGFCYGYVLSRMNFTEKTSEFATIRSNSTQGAIQIITYTTIGVELLAIVLFHILYFINHKTRKTLRRNVSASRLPEQVMAMKYQATENKKTISFFFPIVWTHFVLFTVRGVAISIFSSVIAYTPLKHARYEESTNWMNIYTLVVGAMMTLQFTKLGQRIKKSLRGRIGVWEEEVISVKAVSLNLNPVTRSKHVDHFQQLQNMFERGTL